MPLGQREGDSSDSRYCGAEAAFNDDIQGILSHNLGAGFDFIVATLTEPSYRPSFQSKDESGCAPCPPFAGSDLILSPSQWSSRIVGGVSKWLDLDGSDPTLTLDSEVTLLQELSWASHLSLQACVLPTPVDPLQCANYARCINQRVQEVTGLQLWLRIPLVSPVLEDKDSGLTEDDVYLKRDPASGRFVHDTWEWWNLFRQLCEHNPQLSVVLDITASLPCPHALRRWHGEPVKAAFLHTSAFLTNAKGHPCLSKRHQSFVSYLLSHSVQIILTGGSLHSKASFNLENGPSLSSDSVSDSSNSKEMAGKPHPLRQYHDYLAYLYRKLEPLTEQEKFEAGYRDFLQAPLQPLMDNLEAQTYETFEKDATKYSQYERAVHAALIDRVPLSQADSTTVVLMVVGAGRGPLVRASLQAASEAGRKLRVYAVEKNPNAVVTLHNLISMEGWEDVVTVVSCDMRKWRAPEKADILVSELLGSFGDNELSPECLDGAQRFLKEDGISIPCQYTSFIAPMTASKLFNDVKAYGDLAHFETAYVVKLHKVTLLSSPAEVFTFSHPNRSPTIDNRRHTCLHFELPPDMGSAMLHGFGGYFDAVLYGDIHLGIEPATATPNMFSWFPIFFPLRQPMHVPAGAAIQAHFWRCVGPTKVWYEWSVIAPSASTIHNPNGRSYWVGL